MANIHTVPKALIMFGMQATVSLLTMGFSIYMMVKSTENIQTFLPILTSVSAYWFPSPKFPDTLMTPKMGGDDTRPNTIPVSHSTGVGNIYRVGQSE